MIIVGDLLNEPLEEYWIPLSGIKSGKMKVSADFSPDDRYGTVRRPSEQGSRKASESHDMRKIPESHNTHSRETPEMSESHKIPFKINECLTSLFKNDVN